jgi:hypothetical protein
MYRGTANVEHEVYVYNSNNWSHRNCNKRFKEKFGSHMRKTLNRFTTKDSYTWNITHNTGSTAVWNWKPGGGDQRWFKRSTGKKRPVTRDNNNNNNNNKTTT